MKQVLLGIFPKQEDADAALFELGDAGFISQEVSVIANEDKMKEYQSGVGGEATVTGGILGGLAGLLIAATPVVLPGVGILVAGPLVALTGLAVGAVTGGLLGTLVDLGLSESQAQSYERRIKEGAVLLGVMVDEKTEKKAGGIMGKHNEEELVIVPYTEKKERVSQLTQERSYAAAGVKGGKAAKRK